MKKFFKIGCGGLLALIILGAIIGALGGEDTSTNDDNTETEQQETSAPATEEKTEEKAEEKTKETKRIYIAKSKCLLTRDKGCVINNPARKS